MNFVKQAKKLVDLVTKPKKKQPARKYPERKEVGSVGENFHGKLKIKADLRSRLCKELRKYRNHSAKSIRAGSRESSSSHLSLVPQEELQSKTTPGANDLSCSCMMGTPLGAVDGMTSIENPSRGENNRLISESLTHSDNIDSSPVDHFPASSSLPGSSSQTVLPVQEAPLLPPWQVLHSLEGTPGFQVNPSEHDFAPPIGPSHGHNSAQSPSREECDIESFCPLERRGPELIIYVDSFPGLKNMKDPWKMIDSFITPSPDSFADSEPLPQPIPFPQKRCLKKHRLLSPKAAQKLEWFTDPSRPKLAPIQEVTSWTSGSEEGKSSTGSDIHNSNLQNSASDLQSPQDAEINEKTERTSSTSSSDASFILYSLFKLMEEDTI